MAGKMGMERKSTTRASGSPATTDLHWAAGFLEGEGCFVTMKNGGTQVASAQKDIEPLSRLQRLFGGNIREQKKTPHRIWVWTVCGGRARGVAMTLYTLLSSRRQAKIRELLAKEE